MSISVLVDYDNIDLPIRKKGLLYVIECIVSKIKHNEVNSKNIGIRLYGGWYEKNNLTKRAQIVQTDAIGNFPKIMLLQDKATQVIVNVELAYSIVAKPKEHLFHTYRERKYYNELILEKVSKFCSDTACELTIVYDFFNNNNCSKCKKITTSDMFKKREQKLVDTMITTDIIDLALLGNNISVVSSDDDLWPGILSALNKGVKVIQIHTKGRNTNSYYLNTATSNYSQRNIL